MATAQHPVRLIPLGGLVEVGKNCHLVDQDRYLVVDAGVMFPPGRSSPASIWLSRNFSYLIDELIASKRIIPITHAHEDHVDRFRTCSSS